MKRQASDGVAGALLLIGLGVLIFTGLGWPGIMAVLGIAIGIGLMTEGKFLQGLVAPPSSLAYRSSPSYTCCGGPSAP